MSYKFLTPGWMALDWLVHVVGDRGPVRGLEGLTAAINQRTVESADEALDDCLNVAAETPQAGGEVPKRCTKACQAFDPILSVYG